MLICFVPVCVPGIQFFERCAENSEGAHWLTPFSVILDSFLAVGFLHMLYFFLFDASAQSVLHDYPPFPPPADRASAHDYCVRPYYWEYT